MYCHQYFFGGKYDLIHLHRQVIHQNDGISMRKLLKPSPPAFSIWNLKKTMKMTWLHMEFVLIFITGPSQAKLSRTAWQQLLTLASLLWWKKFWFCVLLLNGGKPLLPNKGRQQRNLLGYDHSGLAGSPEPKMTIFCNLVGVGFGPFSKKLAVKLYLSTLLNLCSMSLWVE